MAQSSARTFSATPPRSFRDRRFPNNGSTRTKSSAPIRLPVPVLQLFGGPAILPVMDGAEHRQRKQLLMAAYTREAIASYFPTLQRLVASALARWSAGGERALLPELKLLAIEGICNNVLGMEPGPELTRLVADYGILFKGFLACPSTSPDCPSTPR